MSDFDKMQDTMTYPDGDRPLQTVQQVGYPQQVHHPDASVEGGVTTGMESLRDTTVDHPIVVYATLTRAFEITSGVEKSIAHRFRGVCEPTFPYSRVRVSPRISWIGSPP